MPGRVLIVDDDRSMCEMIETDLTGRKDGEAGDRRSNEEEAGPSTRPNGALDLAVHACGGHFIVSSVPSTVRRSVVLMSLP